MVYSLFVCHFPWTMDLVSVLNRVKSFSGMIGHVIVDKDSNIVNTTLDTETRRISRCDRYKSAL